MASLYGREYIGDIISDGQAVPQNTSADSTNMADISGGETNNGLSIFVYATTTFTISNTKAFGVKMQSYSADTASSAFSPLSISNSSGYNGATGTALTVASETDNYGWGFTAGADTIYAAGDLICEIPIPDIMLRLLGHTHVQLKYTTTDADVGGTITAFVAPRI